jgi:hypothetical protein
MFRTRIYHIIILIILSNIAVIGQFDSLSTNQWQNDLVFLKAKLETMHPDAWFRYDRSAWEQDYNSLYYQIPLLTNSQRYVRIMQLVASIQDDHTRARVYLHIPMRPRI